VHPTTVLTSAYEGFAAVVEGLDDEASWQPTGCAGWAVRDLILHCVMDAQRGLVALHTPAGGPADRDAVSYWADWRPDPVGSANGRRHVRVVSSMFLRFEQLRGLYLETTAALLHAARDADASALVRTQGHVLTAGDLFATLAVEAAVHHLDLVAQLPGASRPPAAALALVRTTLDGLLGRAVPVEWSDEHYALAGTGRLPLTAGEQAVLGADAERFPLFG
jgi:hypothetical protein